MTQVATSLTRAEEREGGRSLAYCHEELKNARREAGETTADLARGATRPSFCVKPVRTRGFASGALTPFANDFRIAQRPMIRRGFCHAGSALLTGL